MCIVTKISFSVAPYSTSEILPTKLGPVISAQVGVVKFAFVRRSNFPNLDPTSKVVEVVVYGETANAVGDDVKSKFVKSVLTTVPDFILEYLLTI